MAREIEFRVWDGYDKKMLSWEEITSAPEFEKNIPDYLLNVDRYKCMLKTGVCDKNGKEIYAWDIISSEGGIRNFEIFYCEKNTAYEMKSLTPGNWGVWVSDTPLACLSSDEGKNKTMSVVGNIYENPELLEKTK